MADLVTIHILLRTSVSGPDGVVLPDALLRICSLLLSSECDCDWVLELASLGALSRCLEALTVLLLERRTFATRVLGCCQLEVCRHGAFALLTIDIRRAYNIP